MGIVKNEQDVKRETQFLSYNPGDDGNSLVLLSHLYKIDTHFIKQVSRSVICKGDTCAYCAGGFQKRAEYNYMVMLNGETGFIDVKASVFFNIQGIAKAQKKDTRQMSWTVIKKGEGLKTEYTVSKDDNLSKDDYQKTLDSLDKNTERLTVLMEKREAELNANYSEYLFTAKTNEGNGQSEDDVPPPEEP